ncbi:NUDIX domain-containing protein [Lentzea tibetensis]|nr:NUDIX hydrolase [Lentzea tibetensis]
MPSDATRPHPLSPEQYYASRPPVFVGAGAVLLNDSGDILLVKPTYEPRWVIPGGAMEPEETPRQTARREIREELALDRDLGTLLCVDFVLATAKRPKPGVMYLFDGGLLSTADEAAIRLPADELTDYCFVQPTDLPDYIGGRLLRRVQTALAARQTGIPVDLEDGHRPGERDVEA